MASVQRRSVHHLFLVAICAFAVAAPAAAAAQGGPTDVPTSAIAVATTPAIPTTPAIASLETARSTPVEPPFTSAGVAGVHTVTAADALPRADGRAESVSPAALARRSKSGFDHSEVLMIVGGAAVILGLVTDGAASDLLLIGGAGVGLFGLYEYLK